MTVFRKLLPTEMGRYCDHLKRLDAVDRHLRFAGTATDAVIDQHCLRLDWHDTLVIGWFEDNELRGAAELRTEGTPFPQKAEAAFSVERGWQGRGIGAELIRRILNIASNRGIRVVEVYCLLENRKMQGLARKFASSVASECGDVAVTIRLERPDHISFMLEAIEEGASLVSAALETWTASVGKVLH
jgi:GNAT superfamily N-acetyltransferase